MNLPELEPTFDNRIMPALIWMIIKALGKDNVLSVPQAPLDTKAPKSIRLDLTLVPGSDDLVLAMKEEWDDS